MNRLETENTFGLPTYAATDKKMPDDINGFFIAKNGVFLGCDTDDFTAILKMETLPTVTEGLKEGVIWKGPKLQWEDLYDIYHLFNKVMTDAKTEASLSLYWSDEKKTVYLRAPTQIASSASVDWEKSETDAWLLKGKFLGKGDERAEFLPKDLRLIGLAHSHHSMEISWSSTDDNEQKKSGYGIQLLFADMARGLHVMSRLAFNGMYVDVPLSDVVETKEDKDAIPKDILDALKHQYSYNYMAGFGAYAGRGNYHRNGQGEREACATPGWGHLGSIEDDFFGECAEDAYPYMHTVDPKPSAPSSTATTKTQDDVEEAYLRHGGDDAPVVVFDGSAPDGKPANPEDGGAYPRNPFRGDPRKKGESKRRGKSRDGIDEMVAAGVRLPQNLIKRSRTVKRRK